MLESLANMEFEDFNNPQGSLKGIISAAYSLGAILSLPLIPWVNDRFGRRGSIFAGSWIMVIGAIIQGCAQNGELNCKDAILENMSLTGQQRPCTLLLV